MLADSRPGAGSQVFSYAKSPANSLLAKDFFLWKKLWIVKSRHCNSLALMSIPAGKRRVGPAVTDCG